MRGGEEVEGREGRRGEGGEKVGSGEDGRGRRKGKEGKDERGEGRGREWGGERRGKESFIVSTLTETLLSLTLFTMSAPVSHYQWHINPVTYEAP